MSDNMVHAGIETHMLCVIDIVHLIMHVTNAVTDWLQSIVVFIESVSGGGKVQGVGGGRGPGEVQQSLQVVPGYRV